MANPKSEKKNSVPNQNTDVDKLVTHRTIVTIIFILGAVLCLCTPYFLVKHSFIGGADFTGTGQIGDTIGGISSPFVNLLGALLVYWSFKQQLKANEIQLGLIATEREDETKKIDKEMFILGLNDFILDYSTTLDYRGYKMAEALKFFAENFHKIDDTHNGTSLKFTQEHLNPLLNDYERYCELIRDSSLSPTEKLFFANRFLRWFIRNVKKPLDSIDLNKARTDTKGNPDPNKAERLSQLIIEVTSITLCISRINLIMHEIENEASTK